MEAINLCELWLQNKHPTKSKDDLVFSVQGPAGSGKTTLAKRLAEGRKVLYGAYTGKAASVLRKSGCVGASTIHSMIYDTKVDDDGKFHTFKKPYSPIQNADFVIIDESSMVDEDIGADLLSYGKKILFLGDNNQLKPPEGMGFLQNMPIDFLLTEIHRQADDSPIIQLAHDVINDIPLKYGTYGTSSITSGIDDNMFLDHDIVIVGKNDTKDALNKHIRQLKGFYSRYPMIGEKLICLKNDKNLGIYNGMICTVVKVNKPKRKDFLNLTVKSDDNPNHIVPVDVHISFFNENVQKPFYKALFGTQHFIFAYAITAHKSQGSQWENVLIIDESHIFRDEKKNWLYTALTRASNKVTLVR